MGSKTKSEASFLSENNSFKVLSSTALSTLKINHLEIESGRPWVAVEVCLHRPEVKNALSPTMIEELKNTLRSIKNKSEVRALILRGEGDVFCSGADLHWMKSMKTFSYNENLSDSNRLRDLFVEMQQFPKPIVALVEGGAFGGALGLVVCADWVMAQTQTRFCFSEVLLGISPAVISEFVLTKCSLGAVGPYMLTGQVFSPQQAQNMGLVHEIFDTGEEKNKTLRRLLAHLLKVGPEAFYQTKRLLRTSLETLKEGVSTTELIAKMRVSPEGQEGLAAFLEKRNPKWVEGP